MLNVGTTGYGKTNLIMNMISQLNGEIILIDMKGGFDYEDYGGWVTAKNVHEAVEVLGEVVNGMRVRRKDHIFVIVDEAYEMIPRQFMTREEKKPYQMCLKYVDEIARLGRGFHVHLIYCTQYPTREVVTGQIKQCCDGKISFRLPTSVGSLVALDEEGAEKLPAGLYGLGIYKTDVKRIVKSYKFKERDGWCAKVRNKKEKRTENSERNETVKDIKCRVDYDNESGWFRTYE